MLAKAKEYLQAGLCVFAGCCDGGGADCCGAPSEVRANPLPETTVFARVWRQFALDFEMASGA